jgi:sucrose 6(F)-phosphate phosphorylase
MPIRKCAQLITYADALGGNLQRLNTVLNEHFAGLFGGVHILPFYPSSGDRGFAPIDYTKVDPAFGTWDDVRRIGEQYDVLTDLMVNHISRQSPQFQDFVRRGRRSPCADLFITLDKIWSEGEPPDEDVQRIFLRRPDHPFTDITIEETGEVVRIWATFGSQVAPEQIDLDIHSALTRDLLRRFLQHLRDQAIRIVRLDAVGYLIKKPGTSCFFVEPEIYEPMGWLRDTAGELGLTLLPELHAHYTLQQRLAEHGYWVYDFVLPALVLHTLFSRSSRKLRTYLRECPRCQFTTLDCHDGIPIQPDLDGILTTQESQAIVARLIERGANLNRLLSRELHDEGFDAHQVNITYYSALGADDDAYIAARALQFFAPGIPQVYYVGLLAGENDPEAVERTGELRAINRHDYTLAEIEQAVQRPVVQRLFRLIRLRNGHPAFDGDLTVEETPDDRVQLRRQQGDAICILNIDLATCRTEIAYTEGAGRWEQLVA